MTISSAGSCPAERTCSLGFCPYRSRPFQVFALERLRELASLFPRTGSHWPQGLACVHTRVYVREQPPLRLSQDRPLETMDFVLAGRSWPRLLPHLPCFRCSCRAVRQPQAALCPRVCLGYPFLAALSSLKPLVHTAAARVCGIIATALLRHFL